jgi:N-methylhydantoinase B/oxoprolinase/acetone carboxylase alpha subunit
MPSRVETDYKKQRFRCQHKTDKSEFQARGMPFDDTVGCGNGAHRSADGADRSEEIYFC